MPNFIVIFPINSVVSSLAIGRVLVVGQDILLMGTSENWREKGIALDREADYTVTSSNRNFNLISVLLFSIAFLLGSLVCTHKFIILL